jgi:hypothetical protein
MLNSFPFISSLLPNLAKYSSLWLYQKIERRKKKPLFAPGMQLYSLKYSNSSKMNIIINNNVLWLCIFIKTPASFCSVGQGPLGNELWTYHHPQLVSNVKMRHKKNLLTCEHWAICADLWRGVGADVYDLQVISGNQRVSSYGKQITHHILYIT